MDCEKCPVKKVCDVSKAFKLQLVADNIKRPLKRVLSTFCPLDLIVTKSIDKECHDFISYINQKRRFEDPERMAAAIEKELQEAGKEEVDKLSEPS